MACMAWDWEMDEIDPNKFNGELWVPVTPQTLTISTTEQVARINMRKPYDAAKANAGLHGMTKAQCI